MKTTIVLKQESIWQQLWQNTKNNIFSFYCLIHTLLNHPSQLKKVYWSITDCYIEIGKSGYISNGRIYDTNGDVTVIYELIINKKGLKIDFSEPEMAKIKKMAIKKDLSIKDLLLSAVDKLQITD